MHPAQIKVKIISHKRLKENYWHLELVSRIIAKCASPGQFLNIEVGNGIEPLLRRPISIHSVSGSKVRLIYEVVGRGTQILSERNPGDLVEVIGPLGNGFDYSRHACRQAGTGELANWRTILVAGGMGVAPLVFLAEKIKLSKPLVLIGARTRKQVLCSREFKALGCAVEIATDDGSRGFKGKVTDLLKYRLSPIGYRLSAIYACGPRQMLKTITGIARENKINAQFSLEEHMACGIGACLGCVVSTKAGYKRVCKDGPVFSGKELIW
jgi:dihydroorotate dehydrogenase electron transfer subunit